MEKFGWKSMQDILNRIIKKSELIGGLRIDVFDGGFRSYIVKNVEIDPTKDKKEVVVDIVKLATEPNYEALLLSTEKAIDYILEKFYNTIISNK